MPRQADADTAPSKQNYCQSLCTWEGSFQALHFTVLTKESAYNPNKIDVQIELECTQVICGKFIRMPGLRQSISVNTSQVYYRECREHCQYSLAFGHAMFGHVTRKHFTLSRPSFKSTPGGSSLWELREIYRLINPERHETESWTRGKHPQVKECPTIVCNRGTIHKNAGVWRYIRDIQWEKERKKRGNKIWQCDREI